MRSNKGKRATALAVAFATLGISGQAAAADWVMLQAMEPPTTTHKFFGIGQISYTNLYGCDKLQGLVNPGTGSATTAHGLLNENCWPAGCSPQSCSSPWKGRSG